jgi:hypothetical protein
MFTRDYLFEERNTQYDPAFKLQKELQAIACNSKTQKLRIDSKKDLINIRSRFDIVSNNKKKMHDSENHKLLDKLF